MGYGPTVVLTPPPQPNPHPQHDLTHATMPPGARQADRAGSSRPRVLVTFRRWQRRISRNYRPVALRIPCTKRRKETHVAGRACVYDIQEGRPPRGQWPGVGQGSARGRPGVGLMRSANRPFVCKVLSTI